MLSKAPKSAEIDYDAKSRGVKVDADGFGARDCVTASDVCEKISKSNFLKHSKR